MGEPFIAQIIDQKHPLAAQGAMPSASEAETIAAVRKINDAGLWGVKFYTSMNPAWIAPAAARRTSLGLHVLGHIPATMRPLDAVNAGYDEITHINFVVMQAMPEEIVDKANTAAADRGAGQVLQGRRPQRPQMKSFIAELASARRSIDPTLVVWEATLISDGGVPAAGLRILHGDPSPALDRFFKSGGYPLVEGYTRDDYRKS